MQQQEFVSVANQVIGMKWCKSMDDLETKSWNPTYTHQIFGQDELIKDYKEPRINIVYNASNLATWITFTYKEKLSSIKQPTPLEKLTKFKIHFSQDDSGSIPFDYPVITHQSDFKKSWTSFSPSSLGKQIACYTIGSSTFEIIHGTFANPKLVEYHKRIQPFSLFFIQNTSYIDDQDEKWNLFLIFEKYKHENDENYAFVGYSSVYSFYAYPQNQRLRISQFVILPHYQSQGHGVKLLNSIYEYGKQNKAVDVCVEDPAEEFQALRDKVDLKIYQKYEIPLETVWNKELADKLRSETKISENQLYMCYEFSKYSKLSASNKNENLKQDFEKEMKRRIIKEYDLCSYYPDATECKEKLQEIYKEKIESYTERLKK